MPLSKKAVSGQKQGGLLGRWNHWYPRNEKVAHCGHRRKRLGHYPDPSLEYCPTCEEIHRMNGLKGNN